MYEERWDGAKSFCYFLHGGHRFLKKEKRGLANDFIFRQAPYS
jgi:hypothetical protein